jgi:hypothetical protein
MAFVLFFDDSSREATKKLQINSFAPRTTFAMDLTSCRLFFLQYFAK